MGRNSIKKVRNSNVKKRELYIQKLTETFKQHGLKKYTMDSIAAELNVTKATLYHYFSSKDEMVEISLMKLLGQLSAFENIAKNNELDFEVRFYKMLELFSTVFVDISNLYLADLQDEYPLLWQQVQLFTDYVLKVLTNFYNEGKEAGIFKDVNTAILVISDKMFLNVISDIDFMQKNNLTIRTAFDEYFRMKCFGFLK